MSSRPLPAAASDGIDIAAMCPTIMETLRTDLKDIHKTLDGSVGDHEKANFENDLKLLEDEIGDEQINTLQQEIKVRVAMDSGGVYSVTHPATTPDGVKIEPNVTGKHFIGAGGETIHKHGDCITMMRGERGAVGCRWQVADVTRPLHSVSQIAGPVEGPGEHDVLFNNKRCVVMPPGVVDRVLQELQPIAEYPRVGGLYIADMTLSGSTRRGLEH